MVGTRKQRRPEVLFDDPAAADTLAFELLDGRLHLLGSRVFRETNPRDGVCKRPAGVRVGHLSAGVGHVGYNDGI